MLENRAAAPLPKGSDDRTCAIAAPARSVANRDDAQCPLHGSARLVPRPDAVTQGSDRLVPHLTQ
jgi:hypothetical protein